MAAACGPQLSPILSLCLESAALCVRVRTDALMDAGWNCVGLSVLFSDIKHTLW